MPPYQYWQDQYGAHQNYYPGDHQQHPLSSPVRQDHAGQPNSSPVSFSQPLPYTRPPPQYQVPVRQHYQQPYPHYQQYYHQQYNNQQYLQNHQLQQSYQLPPPPQVVIPPRASPVQSSQPTNVRTEPPHSLQQTFKRPQVPNNVQIQLPAPSSSSKPATIAPSQTQLTPKVDHTQQSRATYSAQSEVKTQNPIRALNTPTINIPQSHAKNSSSALNMSKDESLENQDCPILLLALAEEYLSAARQLSSRSREYYCLTATALGCLEATLKNFKLPALRHAQVSLRYAQLVYEETSDVEDVSAVLARTIDLCDRMKFLDLKYAAQLLRVRIMSRQSHKAALKDLSSMIGDLEVYKHTAWEYAFRFEYVFMLAAAPHTPHLQEGIVQLEKVQKLAKRQQDYAVGTFAALLEALLHLQTSSSEAVQNSERALASARSAQSHPHIMSHPQINSLMHVLDLYHTWSHGNEELLKQKAKATKDEIYRAVDGGWEVDGVMHIPLHWQSLRGVEVQSGGLITTIKDTRYLTLTWFTPQEMEALGFLFCGVLSVSQNMMTRGGPEKSLLEGIRVCDELLAVQPELSVHDTTVRSRYVLLQVHAHLELSFMRANRSQWSRAQESLDKASGLLKQTASEVPLEIQQTIIYLSACIAQGTGRTDTALELFSSPSLFLKSTLSQASNKSDQESVASKQIRVLSALNAALITHNPLHPHHRYYGSILHLLPQYFSSMPHNKYLAGCFDLIKSCAPNVSILNSKNLTNHVLEAGKAVINQQLISLALALIQERYFRGGIQDKQAVSCAKAASHQVRTRVGSDLWTAVTSQMGMESAVLSGNDAEAVQSARDIRDRAWRNVPQQVKVGMGLPEVLEQD